MVHDGSGCLFYALAILIASPPAYLNLVFSFLSSRLLLFSSYTRTFDITPHPTPPSPPLRAHPHTQPHAHTHTTPTPTPTPTPPPLPLPLPLAHLHQPTPTSLSTAFAVMSGQQSGQQSGLGGFHAASDAYEPADAAPVSAPDFNPFAALGLQPATATAGRVRQAYIQAMRHRHESAVVRFPATATAFPSQVQVQIAYEYLQGPGGFATARAAWRGRHRDVFHPELDVGAAGVFAGAAAAAGPSNTAANATASGSGTVLGSTAQTAVSISSSPSASPAPQPRPAAASANPGARAPAPIVIDSSSDDDVFYHFDDDDDDDDDVVIVSPARPARPAGNVLARARPRAGPMVAAATGQVAANRVIRPSQRSGGGSRRNAPIPNPVLNERVTVGEWRHSVGATANAVVAGFDARGRIFYRVVNLDLQGNQVAAPTATATRFEDINFRAVYQNLDAAGLRAVVDTHLRLNPYQRP